MGACAILKPKSPKIKVPLNSLNLAPNDLETRQFAYPYDKKTTRAYNKQSEEQMLNFIETQPITHNLLVNETTKQPEWQIQKTEQKISIRNLSSFCQSVQREFEVFQSLSEWEKEQTFMFLQNQCIKKYLNLDQISNVEKEDEIPIDEIPHLLKETPYYLRKYLPMQEYSIEVKYL